VTPEELANRLEKAADRLPGALKAMMNHEGTLLMMRIKANASGRPGPNVVTGRYRASWRIVADRVPGGARVTIGTEAPQGRRLEFGFVGTDSLGRTFNQPPFPHVGPAVQQAEQDLPEAVKRTIIEVIG
jgi:hypothetical protein